MIYRAIFRTFFVHLDPERAHHLAMVMFATVGRAFRGLLRMIFGRGLPVQRVKGVPVRGRLGVAAGFDKDAQVAPELVALGFGFVEIGTVTALAQPGNPRPRLWRLIPERGLRNAMGFNNDGAEAVARRLARVRTRRAGRHITIGVNIGKSKVTPPSGAAADYATSAALLGPYADYLVVNVSSPNTPGLRDLQAVEYLRPILTAVQGAVAAACDVPPPVLVKIAPDLADDDVDTVADLVTELGLAGVVAVNTTIDHDLGAGGISGPRVRPRGVDVVQRVRARLGTDALIMGVGGIETAADAREYLDAGADLVQGYTAFIYFGPAWAGRLNRQLG